MPDRLSSIFEAIRSALTEPLADRIRIAWLNIELSSTQFYFLSLFIFLTAGIIIGYAIAKNKFMSNKYPKGTVANSAPLRKNDLEMMMNRDDEK
ncbi:hypothetical protein H1S01_07075 [Heliobacterium chlorum]|uniref:Uncharacterized protein n=1 Tax=Heliobacterium chlorum TaxID=2698 RepID=A0ABR7T3M6_HELCL|nr:hypothetical protein [Heliobacterium chlorum]MBC9784271.1 hypothetical protein [Heliobacterium chlorum]